MNSNNISKIIELTEGSTLTLSDSFFLGCGSIKLSQQNNSDNREKDVDAFYLKLNVRSKFYTIKAVTPVKVMSIKMNKALQEEENSWRNSVNVNLIGVNTGTYQMRESTVINTRNSQSLTEKLVQK